MTTNCLNCRFSSFAHPGAKTGDCRRLAPRATIGQLDPEARYSYPETAGWPAVEPRFFCGEFEASDAAELLLTDIVRECIFGEGTGDSHQRVIDLCHKARTRFGIERTA